MTKKKPTKDSQPFKSKIVAKEGKRKLKLISPDYFQGIIERLPLDTELTLWFSSKKPSRSLAQNRYLWFYYGIISEDTGEDPEDLHSLFKGLFLENGITEIYGHKVRKVSSSTKLNKLEFGEFLERIEELTGIALPDTSELSPQTYF